MRPSWSSRGLSEEARVNVTPLIDVVMCLIVFYLMVGHLVIVRRGETDLPQTAVGLTTVRDTDPMAITIADGDGDQTAVLIDGVSIPLERVTSVVAGRLGRDRTLAVQIRAGKGTAYAKIEPVLASCREAGITRVELATRQESGLGGGL